MAPLLTFVEDTDEGTHLLGSVRLLNTASTFAAAGGLGEAASWVALRQHIYLTLTRKQPFGIQLDKYRQSRSFYDQDAESLANRAVFLCGQTLEYAFGSDTRPAALDPDEWTQLTKAADEWYESRPSDSCPFWTNGRGDSISSDEPAFPTIWIARPAYSKRYNISTLKADLGIYDFLTRPNPVSGHQHYFLARMLLAIFNPHLSQPSIEIHKRRTEADVCGLP
jgi:hypothetical protein